MLKKLQKWIKNNTIAFLLIIILGIISLKSTGLVKVDFLEPPEKKLDYNDSFEMGISPENISIKDGNDQSNTSVTISKSNISLHVEDVTHTVNEIKAATQDVNGYVVEYRHDTGTKAQTAVIKIRVPKDQVDTILGFLRKTAIRVVSENITDSDVTSQYTDLEERLAKLQSTRGTLEEIKNQTEDVDSIMKIQSQINVIQNQIDVLTGEKNRIEVDEETLLLTIILSTDELALPYMPTEPWSPEAIFKNAFRNMIRLVQGLGSVTIWAFVYSPLLLLAIIVISIVKSIVNKTKDPEK